MEYKLIFHKPIPGIDEDYTACPDGYIYSWKTGEAVELKGQLTGNGYLSIGLKHGDGYKSFTVHRLVAKAWIPNKNHKKLVINHKDANKTNNKIENLEWCTLSENALHARQNGIGVKGRAVYQLDRKTGKMIKEFKSIKKAAKITGINNRTISQVCAALGGSRKDGYRAGRKTAGGFGWCYKEDYGKLTHKTHGCSRKVEQYDMEGNHIKTWDSLNDAAKSIDRTHASISRVCSGAQHTCAGFIWKYSSAEKKDEKTDIEKETKSWKILKEFPGYKISRDGRIYSISYRRCLEGSTDQGGKRYVSITNRKKKLMTMSVHKLVALAYIPNPENCTSVTHLDGDLSNNKVKNLAWVY